ncbi:MAG: tRNA (adenosine(37)-N6)-dimethylallyltransferase MiaA [Flammeovirgaceae bacterium]
MVKKIVLVIVGPTAVGKTDFCVQLAQRYGIEVVSADSRQFYKEMAIGTAKPSPEEIRGVPHYLIDHISIHEDYNVAKYEKDALTCLQNIFKKSNTALLTGGSGLFVKAICDGIDEMPPVKAGIREHLNQIHQHDGLAPLLEELAQADPDYYQKVDQQNHMRVIRALEVIRSTGKTFSSFRSGKKVTRSFEVIKVGLNRDREELYDRINRRMDLMLEMGLVEEAKALYPYKHLSALKTVGYQELFDFWDGKYDWDQAVELLKQNSRRYAKRQLTWFRKDQEIKWFHPQELEKVQAYLETIAPSHFKQA